MDDAENRGYAESGGVRPFGVSLLMAGYDENGPQLYQIDPSGTYFAWKASAIGKNMVRLNNAATACMFNSPIMLNSVHVMSQSGLQACTTTKIRTPSMTTHIQSDHYICDHFIGGRMQSLELQNVQPNYKFHI